jgi:hypothetical protein
MSSVGQCSNTIVQRARARLTALLQIQASNSIASAYLSQNTIRKNIRNSLGTSSIPACFVSSCPDLLWVNTGLSGIPA